MAGYGGGNPADAGGVGYGGNYGSGGSYGGGGNQNQKKKAAAGDHEKRKQKKELAFRHIQVDWGQVSKRRVKTGQRQEDYKDILKRGELSGENWGKTFETNYAQVSKLAGKVGFKNLHATDKLLYEGYQNKQRAGALRAGVAKVGAESSYASPGAFKSAQSAYSTRTASADKYDKLANQSLSRWQAIYNKNTNVVEKTAQSKNRMANREKYAAMKISRERGQAKGQRSALRKGIKGLTVGLGSGLGIPR